MGMVKKVLLPLLIVAAGLLYIFVIPPDIFLVKLLFKVIPMWLIIAYSALMMPALKQRFHWLILIGLFFCMVGDATLHWFVVGLSAFLIGHLFYLSAFFSRWTFSWLRCATIVPLVAYGVLMGRELVAALQSDGNGGLIVPILLYIAVILTMTWSAIMSGNGWAIAGSLFFAASDSILAWNMFVDKLAFAGPTIMLTYYAAQFLIAFSARGFGTGTAAGSRHSAHSL